MKLYNTLTKSKATFEPRKKGKVQMFVCGPTVYDYSHLGHAKTYIQLDVLARTLRALDYEVFYLQNITDIDDKIIQRAQENKVFWEDLRSEFESYYLEDMKVLNNNSVTEYARATDFIPDITQQVQTLMEKGYAYKISDGIYFEISKFPEYGKLSRRHEVQENDAQSRIDQSNGKIGWNDFCLWKFSKPSEPIWDAPFGKGRPGWHIEDTAITEHFFGAQYDIHGGAVDLIFPHHEAELSQMEAVSGKVPFVSCWVHTGFLNIDQTKMSKSLGNFLTIRDVVKKHDPMAVRLLMLQSHYRSTLDFSWESLEAAKNRLKSLRAFADLRFQPTNGKNITYLGNVSMVQDQILEHLADDLNTPLALAKLNKVVDIEAISKRDVTALQDFLLFVDSVFGLSLLDSKDITSRQKDLVRQRTDARDKKDWALSDRLRGDLKKQGIELNDTDHGPIWYRLG